MKLLKNNFYGFSLLDLILLLVLVPLAFIVRYRAFLDLPLDFHSDDVAYMSMAIGFFEGKHEALFHSHWRPFYPFMSALFYPLTSDWAITARLVSIVFGSLLVIPVYLLLKPLLGRMLSVLTAILIISFKPLVIASTRPLTESLFIFLFWFGLMFLLLGLKLKKKLFIFLGGATWSLAFLTRSDGIVLLPGFLVALLVYILILIIRCHLLKLGKNQKFFHLNRITFFPLTDKKIPVFAGKYFAVAAGCFFALSYYLSSKEGLHFFPSIISHGLLLFFGGLVFSLLYITFVVFYYRLQIKVFANIKFYLVVMALFIMGFFLFYAPYKAILDYKFNGSPFFAKFWTFHLRPGGPFELTSDGQSTWAQDVWGRRTVNPHSSVFQYSPQNYQPILLYDILLTNTASRITVFYERYLSGYLNILEILLLAIGGLWVLKNLFKKKEVFFAVFIIVVFFGGMAFIVPTANERYLYSLLPVFPIIIALGIKSLFTGKILQRFLLPAVLLLGVLSLLVLPSSLYFPYQGLFSWPDTFPQRKARNTLVDFWFMSNTPKSRVMARHENVGFYSRSLVVYTPNIGTLPELLDYAKKWQVNYIAAAPEEVSAGLEFLYKNIQDCPGLELTFKGNGMIIYKVL